MTGFPLRKKNRRLQLVIAITALIGLEFDVLCNPFAPTLILHRLMSSCVDSQQTPADDSWEFELFDLADLASGSGESVPGAWVNPNCASFGVALLPHAPNGATTNQPRATPWEQYVDRPFSALKGRNSPVESCAKRSSDQFFHDALGHRAGRFDCSALSGLVVG